MHRSTRTTFAALAVGATLIGAAHAQSLDGSGVSAVPTYEAAGLYWNGPSGATASGGCEVKFRAAGSASWSQGLAMVYDGSANQCRGSLVNLVPGTTYEAELNLPGHTATKSISFTTWANAKPVAQTIKVASGSQTLDVNVGGNPDGYVVYDGTGATLDAGNNAAYNITINASYVIVRGFTLRGAQQHGILIDRNQHDVIIEDNDISGWGRTRDGQWGTDMDSGIRAICQNEELTRVTVQRNRIHDPRYSANSWDTAHPAGPQALTFSYCGGNNVYRWNEIYSASNYFNDGMGGEDNFSTNGWPNADSDVYGNKISMANDDGIEAEGGDRNVRIWGNYLDRTGTGIASTVDSVGPLYVWRNVWNRNTFLLNVSPDNDQREPFFKSGSSSDFNNGRRYLFHNTMLQPTQPGLQYALGGGAGIGGTGDTQLVHNTISMNNIFNLWKPQNTPFYQVGSDNTFQNDVMPTAGSPEVGALVARPSYAAGNGDNNADGGMYQLAAGSPGYDKAVRIPNFNDHYNGSGPDVGAAEAGDPAMRFGIAAASAGSSVGGPGSTTTTTTTPGGSIGDGGPSGNGGSTGSSGSSGDAGGSGTGTVSATMDSSAYTIAAGGNVTFTARVSGGSGTPTGSMTFRANGSTIAGCSGVAVSGGAASCSTSSLGGGSYAVTGVYSGDATYGVAQAGPITQTVTGAASQATALPTSFGIDASSYTVGAGANVTFTATIPGNGGTAQFQDNGSTLGACSAVGVSQGVATCTASLASAGSHAIRAVYSGSGGYSNGVAGPITLTVTGGSSNGGSTTGPTINVQGLWWGSASQSGWGVNLTQQGNLLFATWFTYDAQGQGQWLVMSAGALTGSNTWSGTLYRTRGPAFSSGSFDPSQVSVTPVGTASFAFGDAGHGTFTATVDGVGVAKSIVREVFDASMPVCVAANTTSAATNYQDLWWRANGSESGWGINLTHQGNKIFLTWFTYDANGNGTWLVASDMTKTAPGVFTGSLYRTTGPAFNAAWDPSRVGATQVGVASLSFSDGNDGTFSYSVNGVTGSKPITRQVFATPKTTCN